MAASEPSAVPKRFRAFIGGFSGRSYLVELRDGALTYTEFGSGMKNPKAEVITPSEAEWREFCQTLDKIKVWRWRTEYRNEGVFDGTQWALDIDYGEHAIKTKGNNNYPDASGKPNGKPEPTKSFSRYLAAVKKLTGGKTFQ